MKLTSRVRRAKYKKRGNNPDNKNKNLCNLEVATRLGVSENTKYLHTKEDVLRALRQAYTVRSCKARLGTSLTVGSARKKLIAIAKGDTKAIGFLVIVSGKVWHSLFLLTDGSTEIDTNPKKNDRRKIEHCYLVRITDLNKFKSNTDDKCFIRIT
jgi:hypothetical protein